MWASSGKHKLKPLNNPIEKEQEAQIDLASRLWIGEWHIDFPNRPRLPQDLEIG